jgi:hypothetical protein
LRILNVHERELTAPAPAVGALINSLASDQDALWPRTTWPAMRFDRPLAAGAIGGHGPIRYAVEEFQPGHMVKFRFLGPRGFNGHHRFDVLTQEDDTAVLRHTIDMSANGLALLAWLLAIRPLHDALLEDALAQAQTSLGLPPVVRPWSLWVKVLRWLMSASRARAEHSPSRQGSP